jgi:hypothetical protein
MWDDILRRAKLSRKASLLSDNSPSGVFSLRLLSTRAFGRLFGLRAAAVGARGLGLANGSSSGAKPGNARVLGSEFAPERKVLSLSVCSRDLGDFDGKFERRRISYGLLGPDRVSEVIVVFRCTSHGSDRLGLLCALAASTSNDFMAASGVLAGCSACNWLCVSKNNRLGAVFITLPGMARAGLSS